MIAKLYWMFFKLGSLAFGGGYALIALIYSEGSAMVGLTAQEFADMTALELLASGPVAINSATYIGFIKAGLPGSLAATAAVCTPSIVLCIIVYYFLTKYKDSEYLKGFLTSIKMATGGLMLNTAIILGKDIFLVQDGVKSVIAAPFAAIDIMAIVIFGLCLFALIKIKMNPIKVIFIAAFLGIIFLR
ncbi:chromate transporter [Anaeropeptidivorans aminofermentans]|jgi:chromate transporter|uniref:chromate transporter n=1 Tax=Anaeropeptidivorans aminofermentans TaxID=2934315 RepID=UPI002024465C|nr:chromate transporter [Anaeropeptidivorans aminofermentans]